MRTWCSRHSGSAANAEADISALFVFKSHPLVADNLLVNVRFGDFRFDSGTRLLYRGSEALHLTRKALELLALLLERRPNAVSKEDIHTQLWATTYVSEASLQGLISEIRTALDDDARHARFIRTAHGFGYAFSGSVMELDEKPARSGTPRAWLIGDFGRVPLLEGINTIGRSGQDVIALDSPTVSRRHARLILGEQTLLEDLGSKNATILNARPVEGLTPVVDGDRIRIGTFLFTFRTGRPAGTTKTVSTARRAGGQRKRQ